MEKFIPYIYVLYNLNMKSMYYEYHLKNGDVVNSDKPYLPGIYVYLGEVAYCPDLDEWYEVDSFIEVSYCIIKEGTFVD